MSAYEEELQALIDTLQHGADVERYDAATALGHYTVASTPLAASCKGRAVDALVQALENDPDPFASTRAAAARALGKLGDERAVEPLTTALGSEHSTVQDAAREALGNIQKAE